MNWKTKALIQNLISKLPSKASYALYEWIQMHFGSYRHGNNPFGRLEIGAEFLQQLDKLDFDVHGRRVVEVGGGRSLLVPLACWLCGAERIYSVDLHPYLAEDMFLDDLSKLQANRSQLIACFGKLAETEIFLERIETFVNLDLSIGVPKLLEKIHTDYLAPADATELSLETDSVDLHLSVAVFEHIPAEILEAILIEGKRVTKDGGWFVNRWDMSDHFSHKDPSINAVNFLQFRPEQWKKYNDNRYMYVNRLRIDYFDELHSKLGLDVRERRVAINERALNALKEGFPTVAPFDSKPHEVNATTAATFFAQK